MTHVENGSVNGPELNSVLAYPCWCNHRAFSKPCSWQHSGWLNTRTAVLNVTNLQEDIRCPIFSLPNCWRVDQGVARTEVYRPFCILKSCQDMHLPIRNNQPENNVLVLLECCREQGYENALWFWMREFQKIQKGPWRNCVLCWTNITMHPTSVYFGWIGLNKRTGIYSLKKTLEPCRCSQE